MKHDFLVLGMFRLPFLIPAAQQARLDGISIRHTKQHSRILVFVPAEFFITRQLFQPAFQLFLQRLRHKNDAGRFFVFGGFQNQAGGAVFPPIREDVQHAVRVTFLHGSFAGTLEGLVDGNRSTAIAALKIQILRHNAQQLPLPQRADQCHVNGQMQQRVLNVIKGRCHLLVVPYLALIGGFSRRIAGNGAFAYDVPFHGVGKGGAQQAMDLVQRGAGQKALLLFGGQRLFHAVNILTAGRFGQSAV